MTHALIGNVGDGNISAMGRLIVVKFHKGIANRWLFMTQSKTMDISLHS